MSVSKIESIEVFIVPTSLSLAMFGIPFESNSRHSGVWPRGRGCKTPRVQTQYKWTETDVTVETFQKRLLQGFIERLEHSIEVIL